LQELLYHFPSQPVPWHPVLTTSGAEWVEELQKRIEKYIEDPEKQRQLIELVDQEVKIFEEMTKETDRFLKKLISVDKNYNATPEDFKNVLSEFNEIRNRLRNQSLDDRFKMKALCSVEEWKEISGISAKKSLLEQLQPSNIIN